MEFVFRILRVLGYLFLPMFFRPPSNAGLYGVLHAFLVVLITIGLRLLQDWRQWTRLLDSGPEVVRQNWAPILFLLCYALLWFGVWLWSLFRIGEEPTEFPDLDAAWDEVLTVLGKNGIGLGDTPIYLVLGRFTGDESALFGAGPPLVVAGAPGAGAPLRAWAHREAIYISAAGASLLGRQADLLEGPGTSSGGGGGWSDSASIADVEKSIGMSMADGGALIDVQAIIRRAREENRSLTAEEHRRIRELTGMGGGMAAAGGPRSSHPSIVKNAEEADRLAARLRHLCRLIGRARWPLCPLNGIAVLVTMNATDTDEDAQQFGLAARRDLLAVRDAGRLHCPVYALIGDLDRLAGSQEFFLSFPAEKRRQRLGKGYPLVPAIAPDTVTSSIETNVRWITDSLLPHWVYRMFRVEAYSGGAPETIEANAQLYHFLTDLRERAPRLAKLVAHGVVVDLEAPPLFGGCYLAGPDGGGERPFVPGFWKRIDETQGTVAWTADAFDDDARYRGRTQLGYAALGVAVALVAALAVYVFRFKND